MSAYLKIENVGVCPEAAFTVMGVSLADTSDHETIGCFGSGSKQSVALLLRNGLKPVVFCDSLRMEFDARVQTVGDDLASKDFGRVQVKYSGKDSQGRSRSATEDLGFVLEYGNQDWEDVSMAIREFVSNAIDRSIRETGNWSAVKVEIVEENQVRAKKGTTRVFVPLNADVLEFYNNLGKWFLHFSEPDSIDKQILPKAARNLGDRKAAVIYRRGVRVREFESTDTESLFDYNLNHLRLDEARKASDWDVRHHAGRTLAEADDTILRKLLGHLVDGGSLVWEYSFDTYSLQPGWGDNSEQKQVWQEAFSAVAGDKAVVTSEGNAERLTRKGFKPVVLPEGIRQAAEQWGVKAAADVLTQDEASGREILPATEAAQKAVDFAWGKLERLKLTMGKTKPPVKCFAEIMSAGSEVQGFQRGDGVYLANGISDVFSEKLVQVAFEEVAHYITGATDCSRDFQDFAFRALACITMERA